LAGFGDNHPVMHFGNALASFEIQYSCGHEGQQHELPALFDSLVFDIEVRRSFFLLI
jgi:hypothetical protein